MARKPAPAQRTADASDAAAAAATADGRPLQAVLRRPRICFERIVPDALDAEAHVRRALRGQMVQARGGTLDAGEVVAVARMAVALSKRWGPGYVLRCRFLDGSARMQAKVRRHAVPWQKAANVKIRFVQDADAEVRISFYADEGSWSAVGRDALNERYFPKHQPTMNFGWVRDDSDPVEDRAVVLHEFGHALGCLHEHQSPSFTRKWNKAAVLKYFQGPPNFWNADDIQSNVLAKYSPRGVKATRFDPASIMLYAFDAELFADGQGPTNENTTLSALDRQMIAELYPR